MQVQQPSALVGRVSRAFSVSTCGLPTRGTSAGGVLLVTMAMDVPAPNIQNIPVSTFLFPSICHCKCSVGFKSFAFT